MAGLPSIAYIDHGVPSWFRWRLRHGAARVDRLGASCHASILQRAQGRGRGWRASNGVVVADVVSIGGKRTFSLDEAISVLPVVRRVTERAHDQYHDVKARLHHTRDIEGRFAIEEELQDIIRAWARSIDRLGGKARPLWTVDFDHGSGYYCWQFPEPTIAHHHGYREGFEERTPFPNAPA